MTIISGTVKSVAYHPDVSEATAAYSASVIDVFEARRRLSSEADGMAKEAEKEQGNRQAVYWLISLALLISLGPSLFRVGNYVLGTTGVISRDCHEGVERKIIDERALFLWEK